MVPIDASFYNFATRDTPVDATAPAHQPILTSDLIGAVQNSELSHGATSADPTALHLTSNPPPSKKSKRASMSGLTPEMIPGEMSLAIEDLHAQEAAVIAGIDPVFRNGSWTVNGFDSGLRNILYDIFTAKNFYKNLAPKSHSNSYENLPQRGE